MLVLKDSRKRKKWYCLLLSLCIIFRIPIEVCSKPAGPVCASNFAAELNRVIVLPLDVLMTRIAKVIMPMHHFYDNRFK